jgi:hypothetical protein
MDGDRMNEVVTSNEQLILRMLNCVKETRPGFDEALTAIRAALAPRDGVTEAYRRWPDPHDSVQGSTRYGFLEGARWAGGAPETSGPEPGTDSVAYRLGWSAGYAAASAPPGFFLDNVPAESSPPKTPARCPECTGPNGQHWDHCSSLKAGGDACQHDLLKPGTTIEVIDKWKAKCKVCIEFFDLPGRPEPTPLAERLAGKTGEHHRDMSGDYPQRTTDCLACSVGNPGVYVKDGVMYCPHRPEVPR